MFSSLRFRMISVIILFAILPQILVATIVGRRSSAVLEQQSLVLQRGVAADVSSNVDAFVREHANELVSLDEVHGLGVLDTEAQRKILKNLLHTRRVFHELVLVDGAGEERIHLSRTDVVLDSELGSRADRPEFLQPTRRGEIYFGPAYFDEAFREPLMLISVPLFDQRQGDVVAVLIANLRFKPVWDMLARAELPSGGDAYVLNQAGQVIAHRKPDMVLGGRTVSLTVAEGRGPGLSDSDVFFAKQALGFGEQQLQIVAEQSAASALELVEANTRLHLIVVVLTVLLASGLAVVAGGQVVGPIERLVAATRAMERSDFSMKVEPRGKGEIAELARAFNAMQAELQSVVSSLQQEVVERRRTEAVLQIANERLLELDRLKSKFIDDVSHELRTPITNFRLYLDLLAQCGPDRRTEYQAVLNEESRRLATLCNGILDFSNLQKSLDKTNLASIDLNALVADVVVDFEQLALSRGLKLSFAPSAEAHQVWGNAELLEHVVINLLENAILYTLSGHVRLSTHQASKGDPIRLTIEDTGIGMDEEELAHCFERFYRGKRVGQLNVAPGAGLGLAEVKDIVEFHDGWVDVESEVERGCVVSVYLPRPEK